MPTLRPLITFETADDAYDRGESIYASLRTDFSTWPRTEGGFPLVTPRNSLPPACSNCGQWYSRTTTMYCTSCTDIFVCIYCCGIHRNCSRCRRIYARSQNTCQDERLCETCTTRYCNCQTCEGCGNTTIESNICPVCNECMHGCCSHRSCYECDEPTENLCNNCDRCRDCCVCLSGSQVEPHARIYQYSASPIRETGMPRLALRGKRLYGVEAEVEITKRSNDNRKLVKDVADILLAAGEGRRLFILKEDGSLNNGFEIVTIPMTLNQHRKFWSKVSFPQGIASFTKQTTGIHVHISNPPAVTKGKVFEFLNKPENWPWMESLGQRAISERSHYYAPAIHYSTAKDKTRALKGARWEANHYYLYNPNTGKGTAEVRFFKGNTNPLKIVRAVEFVAAVHAWAEEEPIKKTGLDSANFFSFIKKTPKAYPQLANWLREYTGKINKNYKEIAPDV